MSQDARLQLLEEQGDLFVYHRRLQLIFFILRNILIGVQDSIILPSAWQYLKRFAVPKWIYGAVIATYPLSASFLAPVLGMVYDKTKKTREILQATTTVMVLGSLLYSLPYSPWLLFTGRLLSGIGYATEPVICAEVTLSTQATERISHLSYVHLGFVIGITLGPPLTFGFQNVNITIGEWPIDYTNAPGLAMGLLWLLFLIPQHYMVSNVVLNYNIMDIEEDENIQLIKNQHDSQKKSTRDSSPSRDATGKVQKDSDGPHGLKRIWQSVSTSVKDILKLVLCLEVFATLASAFWSVAIINVISVLMPLVLQEDFDWSVLFTNVAFLIGGLIAATTTAVFGAFGKYIKDTTCILILNCIGIVTSGLLVVYYFCTATSTRLAFFFAYLIILGAFSLLTFPCTTSVMSKIHPSDTQGSIQSLTNVVFTAASAFGSLWGSLIYKHMLSLNITTACFFFLCNVLFGLSLARIRARKIKYQSTDA